MIEDKKLNLMNLLALPAIVVVGLCVYFYYANSVEISELVDQKNIIESDVINLEASVAELKKSLDQKDAYSSCLDKASRLTSLENKNFMPKIILDLSDHMFDNIFISELRVADAVYINGFAQNMQIIVDLLHNLSNLSYICNGKIVELKTGSIGKTFLEFMIKLDFNPSKEVDNGKDKKAVGFRS